MVTLTADGIATLAATSDVVHRRQDAPPMFDISTVAYAARPDYVLSASSLLERRVRAVEVPRHRALDIDDELDFVVAETLLAREQR
jgi:CMP-N-acetylneuraminic acid synthetase